MPTWFWYSSDLCDDKFFQGPRGLPGDRGRPGSVGAPVRSFLCDSKITKSFITLSHET